MRKLVLILAGALGAFPAFAARQLSVADVQQLLAQLKSEKDAAAAKELADVRMTERVSSYHLSQWQSDFPGPKARKALLVLADASAFLELPAEEIPPIEKPAFAEQRRMMALALTYVKDTLPRLPDFYATRETTRFVDLPEDDRELWTTPKKEFPFRFLDKSNATVLVRDSKEVVGTGKAKERRGNSFGDGLVTEGVFGPITARVIVDAAAGSLSWSHWEQYPSGPRAVFKYSVPQSKSHYQVRWCCYVDKQVGNEFHLKNFEKLSGYHGEIAIDPEHGTILRISMIADLDPGDPILKSSIAVSYGPVEIGGKMYNCPVKSVSLAYASVKLVLRAPPAGVKAPPTPMQTSLNDVVFGNYHLFRTESRIIMNDDAASNGSDSKPGQAGTPQPAPPAKPQR